MRYTLCAVCCASFAGFGAFVTDETPPEDRLPGARAEVHAELFPTLQAALDALPADGGIVHLPPGVFEIIEPLRVTRPDVLIQGCGTATHIRNLDENGQSALIVAHPDGNKVARGDRLWRVQLADFRITGNEKSGHGIEAIQIEEIFIHGVTVSYHGKDGIRLDHCYEDPRICDSLITYNKGTGLDLLGCHDIVVSANQFEENQDALHCINSYNLCMTGNNLDDHLGHGVVIENTYGSVVSGNMIEECNGTAIVLDRDCYGDTVSSNVIAHNGAGVDLRDAHGCAVSANTFTIMKTDALRVGPDSGRIAVTGNNFSNSEIGGGVKRGTNDLLAAGVVLESTRDVVLSGNVFAGLAPKGVELRGEAPSHRILFSNNLLVDAPGDQKRLDGAIEGTNVDATASDDK